MRSLVRLTALALVVAGCGSGAASSSPPSPPQNSAASPSLVAPSPSVPASDAPASGASGQPIPGGPLEPGSYTSSASGVTVTFEVDEAGWNGIADLPGAGTGLYRDEIQGGMTITTFGGEVFSQPCSSEGTETIDATAAAFVAWLAAHPELQATEPVETTLAGHPALQVDVTSDVAPECPDAPRIWLWVLPTVGDFHLDENEAARFVVADIGAQPTVIVIETFDMTQQQALLDATAPIVESMVIEP